MVGATVLVHLSAHDRATPPPYRLINRTRTPVYCNQAGVPTRTRTRTRTRTQARSPDPDPSQAGVAAVTTRVPPHGSAACVLDAPSLPPLLQVRVGLGLG